MSTPPRDRSSPWRSTPGAPRPDQGAAATPPGRGAGDAGHGRDAAAPAGPARATSPWKDSGASRAVRHDAPAPRHEGGRTRGAADVGTAPAAGAAGAGDAARAGSARTEIRLHGLNAVRAVFARRPEAIRKVYVAESRIPSLQPLLKWCAAHRVGYRVVDVPDLQKLAASAHHEGVVADVLREEPLPLSTWLRDLPDGPRCALWLDGVGNPHNFGAILRAAAHFGVDAILLPKDATLALSGAAARVAEGGAEAVPLVRLGRSDNAVAQLRGAGFALAATVVDGGDDAFAAELPQRLVYVIGAEGEGMDRAFAQACDLRLSIPGSGAVESLNVASATAVFLAAWRRSVGMR